MCVCVCVRMCVCVCVSVRVYLTRLRLCGYCQSQRLTQQWGQPSSRECW